MAHKWFFNKKSFNISNTQFFFKILKISSLYIIQQDLNKCVRVHWVFAKTNKPTDKIFCSIVTHCVHHGIGWLVLKKHSNLAKFNFFLNMHILVLFVKYARTQNKFKNYLKMVKTTQKSTKFILSWHTNDFFNKKVSMFPIRNFFFKILKIPSLYIIQQGPNKCVRVHWVFAKTNKPTDKIFCSIVTHCVHHGIGWLVLKKTFKFS